MAAPTSTLPPAPPSLKPLGPYLQRYAELTKADPVMSYWCLYYAAQQGIAAKAAQDKESKTFLILLLDKLEEVSTRNSSLSPAVYSV